MKKTLVVLLAVALLAAVCCIGVSAADNVDDIVSYAHTLDAANQVPDDIYEMAEGVLRQVPVSAEQATRIKAVLDDVKTSVPTYKGVGAEVYTPAEREAVLQGLDDVGEILKMNIEVKEIKQGDTSDIAVSLTYNNQEVGVIDFDAINDTGASLENAALVAASVVCVLGAAAFVTVAMRKKAYEN